MNSNDTTALKVIVAKLRERRSEIIEALASGACKDFGEYRNLCGVIHGLELAERDLLDLQSAMEHDDDD
jgi:hypothetical protein